LNFTDLTVPFHHKGHEEHRTNSNSPLRGCSPQSTQREAIYFKKICVLCELCGTFNQHKGTYYFLFKPQSTQREAIYFLKLCVLCELCGTFNQHKGTYYFLFKPQSTQREAIYFKKLCVLCELCG